jgi:hypothetical protein
MLKDVKSYCETCHLCATAKSQTQCPYGLLYLLEVLERPWQWIGIDFVGPFPSSRNRHSVFNQIAVVIDHLTAVHLIPARNNYSTKDVAEIIISMAYQIPL